jgi:Tol biopolymer transport system component
MPLSSGTRIGTYEVEGKLGAGGMGEVYKARDTRLSRHVAIKVLPDLVANDPERVARFEREAQVLAALSHPHIGAIYGLEVADGGKSRYLILEFIDGESLATRLIRGAVPFDEAVTYARQMLDALEAAHEKGIVHRDLKPGNVMLTTENQIKILDFGLARVIDSDPTASQSNSPTLTFAATQAGVVLGTAAYMSPEQAKGRVADRRSDVWAFGCVFFEMLTGKRVFDGEDVSETLAAVLRADPDWNALPADVPPGVRILLRRCLARDRKTRIPEIGTVRFLLQDALTQPAAPEPAPVVVAPAKRPLWKTGVPVALAAIAAGALGVTAAWYFRPVPARAMSRFGVPLPDGVLFTATGRHNVALSPDGARMVFIGGNRLFLRSMSDFEAKPIQGTDAFSNVTEPVFSPDGQWLAFFASIDNTIKRMAISGGAATTICPAQNPYGMTWGEYGIAFGQAEEKGIMRVSPNGGTPERVVTLKDNEIAHLPQILPGGETVLFTLGTGTAVDRWEKADIVVQSLKSGARKRLIPGGSDARYLPTGHLVYASGGTLLAVAFDLNRLEPIGGPVPVVEGVRRSPGGSTGAAQYSVSANGSLIYVPGAGGSSSAQVDIVVADRNGGLTALKVPTGAYESPRVSPDGKRITFSTQEAKEAIVWTFDLAGTSAIQHLTYGGNNRFPIWSSDSKRVTYQSDRDKDLAIFWQLADGTGRVERLTKPNPGESHEPESWSPPPNQILLFNVRKGGDVTLWMLSLPDRKVTQVAGVHSTTSPTGAVFSRDGRWVAYTSTEGSKTTIYVQPFPPTGAKYEVLARGADVPHEVTWSADDKELFYNPRQGGFEAVTVFRQPTVAFGNPSPIPRSFTLGPPSARRAYDVTPDGKFIALAPAGTAAAAGATSVAVPVTAQMKINVVLNWFEELRQRVPR